MTHARATARTTVLALTLLLAACANPDGRSPSSSSDSSSPSSAPRDTPANLDALLPDRLRIHPLTRLSRETGDSGSPATAATTQLICHIDLKDRFGHSTKALGHLRIELYRPIPDEPGGSMVETQDLVWELDLHDPDKNALLYDDLVTRTYAIRLGGLPDWLLRWSTGESREPWVTLKATFTFTDRKGSEHRLESTYRMQK